MTLLLAVQSCQQGKTAKQYFYFDIEGFFKKEADRLTKYNPVVEKRVSKNNQAEQKSIRIKNWKTELELFSASDINKPAWKDSYSLQENQQKIIYTAKSPDLRIRQIVIQKNIDNSIRHIHILNTVENTLYTSIEELDYYPDSIYQIKKEQKVQLIGANRYTIIGKTTSLSGK